MAQEIPISQIILTQPIKKAIFDINPSASIKGLKFLTKGEQGFPLSRIKDNIDKDISTMPPIKVKLRSDGLYELLDGRHRIAISVARGLQTISANVEKTGGLYLPKRYFSGLSQRRKTQRKKELEKRSKLSWRDEKAYKPFSTDKNVKTRRSKYILEWKRRFPKSSGLSAYSKATGVPLKTIRKSYNRGMAAWRTGHRPGATQQQWGYARAASMLLCGKTHYTTDADLVRDAKKTKRGRSWFKKMCGEK